MTTRPARSVMRLIGIAFLIASLMNVLTFPVSIVLGFLSIVLIMLT